MDQPSEEGTARLEKQQQQQEEQQQRDSSGKGQTEKKQLKRRSTEGSAAATGSADATAENGKKRKMSKNKKKKKHRRGKAKNKKVNKNSAPSNTTQFIMNDHGDTIQYLDSKLGVNKNDNSQHNPSASDAPTKRISRARESSFSLDSDEDFFYSSPEDEEEFISKEFLKDYNNCRSDRLIALTKGELITEYLQMEQRIDILEKKISRSRRKFQMKNGVEPVLENGTGDQPANLDPKVSEKIRAFQQEIKILSQENRKLRRENQTLRNELKANNREENNVDSEDSSSSFSSYTTSCSSCSDSVSSEDNGEDNNEDIANLDENAQDTADFNRGQETIETVTSTSQ